MPKKKKGKGKGAEGPPGDWPLGSNKERTAVAELSQARSKNTSILAELQQRSDEVSRVSTELRIAQMKRDEARAVLSGQGGDFTSVQRDFARLFKVGHNFILHAKVHLL